MNFRRVQPSFAGQRAGCHSWLMGNSPTMVEVQGGIAGAKRGRSYHRPNNCKWVSNRSDAPNPKIPYVVVRLDDIPVDRRKPCPYCEPPSV